jgi:3-methyladenine DNA glycosylase AlkD
MAMTLKETLAQLEFLGNEKVRTQNRKQGASDKQFGVSLGSIRKVAAKIKTNTSLGEALWDTGNVDAQFLATLIVEPTALSVEKMNRMVSSIAFSRVADWFNSYILAKHPEKEALRANWIDANDRWAARAGWSLTAERVAKNPEGLDITALLNRVESEMPDVAPEVQWTMNSTLATIGIHMPTHRKRAISIGEKLGIYRDYPVSKGCTSPFAPIWIDAMVSRQS